MLEHDELVKLPARLESCHRLDLAECLRWLAIGVPEIAGVRFRLWAVEVDRVAPSAALSATVADAASTLAACIAATAVRLGRD